MYCPVSSIYNFSSLELQKKRKATQQRSFHVANDIVLNQVRVYHERVHADKVASSFWFVRCSSSQHYSKCNTNVNSEKASVLGFKNCKTRFFIRKLNLNFLRSSRHFNFDTVFPVSVFFLKENIHGLSNISKRRVKTRFQVVEF